MKADVWRIQPKRADYILLKMRQLYCKCIIVVEKIYFIKTYYDIML